MKYLMIVFMLSLLLVVGCATPVDDFNSCIAAGNPAMESYPRQCKHDGVTYTEVISAPVLPSTLEDAKETAAANNKFAFDFYNEYDSATKNVFFSPYSLSTAMAMAYEGAAGNTATEIQQTFYYPYVLRAGSQELISGINAPSDNYSLSVVNALWAQDDFVFLPDYLAAVKSYYGAEITNLDFKTQPERSRITINDWVEVKTNDKIKDLLLQGSITSDTRSVLTNAIYFKGSWDVEFDEDLTEKDVFHGADGDSQVDMMRMFDERFRYYADDGLQMIELPYKGDELSMIVFLGDEYSDLEDRYAQFKENSFYFEVELYLPRFIFSTSYTMPEGSSWMGMTDAFDPLSADFSGMTGSKDLFISTIVHKAFVEVNEEGTEAAAATGIIVGVTSAGPIEVPVFRVDKPFVFIIEHKQTRAILFMGKVNEI